MLEATKLQSALVDCIDRPLVVLVVILRHHVAGYADPTDDEDASIIVPLPNVCDCTLKKVLQYCEHSSGYGVETSGTYAAAANSTLANQRLEWEEKYMQVCACMPLFRILCVIRLHP